MLIESVAALMARELDTLRREISAYPDEASVWRTHADAPNSGGVLARHLCGNLQHFVGAVLGGTGYQRDRDAEFSGPPTARAELLADIVRTKASVAAALARVTPMQLAATYPATLAGRRVETGDLLVHLTAHLAYHLGQVDYHRRITVGGGSVNAMAIPEMASATPE